ncbi:MAG: hypothetical protein K2X27_21795 [Candidatus Obscuribacterales bacterium]|nr:hypothetical protein [Candidatus Obscuribacterales bacterium]
MAPLFGDDARSRKMALIAATALSVSLIVFGAQKFLQDLNALLFRELLQGFSELLPSLALTKKSFAENAALNLLLLFLITYAAIWISKRFTGAPRLVLLIQTFIVSLLFQLGFYHFFQSEGQPLSIILCIVLASFAGKLLKKRSEEHRELEARQIELKLRNSELQESRLALVKQDESERRLLAADLHDQVLNDLRTIQKRFEAFARAPSSEEEKTINELLKQSMSDIREIMDELCPAMLEEFGLAAAIEERLDKGSQIASYEVRFQNNVASELLESMSAVENQLIYRLVQESLTNINKHAQAKMVRVSIEAEESDIIFRVSDDGKGIDPGSLSESSRGTLYMRLRAALIGAKVTWMQGPDQKGTTVEIRLHVQSSGS